MHTKQGHPSNDAASGPSFFSQAESAPGSAAESALPKAAGHAGHSRRSILAGGVGAMLLARAPAYAQTKFADRPIHLIVGFAPGGASDLTARMMAEPLGKILGQTVVVENRIGANGTTGTQYVAKAAPDGHTLLFSGASMYGQDQTYFGKDVRYEPRDFTPITEVMRSTFIVTVKKGSSISSVRELVAQARKNPGGIFYGSSGNGSLIHLAGIKFNQTYDVKLEHVPFRGGGPAILALLAGDIQLSFASTTSVSQYLKGGQLTGLAVTSAVRSKLYPDLPTLQEEGGAGFEMENKFGLFGPANMPSDLLNTIYRAAVRVVEDPDFRRRLADAGNETAPSKSPEAYLAQCISGGQDISNLMTKAGLKAS